MFFCIWFLSFLWWRWHTTLIGVQMLNHLCSSGINPIWSWSMTLSLNLICWYSVKNFCMWIHQRYRPIIFLSVVFLSGFGVKVLPPEWGKAPSSSIVEKLEKNLCQLFFKCLGEVTSEAIWSWGFVCWDVFNSWYNLTGNSSVQMFYFFMIQSC